MFKSSNSSQTPDRELMSLTDNEMELVSGGAINPYPIPKDRSNDDNGHYGSPANLALGAGGVYFGYRPQPS